MSGTDSMSIGQVRQHAKVETDGDGIQYLVDRTSEVWTGTEWVDVRALLADAERVRRVRELAEDLDARGVRHSVLEYAEVAADLRRALDGDPT